MSFNESNTVEAFNRDRLCCGGALLLSNLGLRPAHSAQEHLVGEANDLGVVVDLQGLAVAWKNGRPLRSRWISTRCAAWKPRRSASARPARSSARRR